MPQPIQKVQKEYFQPLSNMIVDYVDSYTHRVPVQMHYHNGYEILFFEQVSAQFMLGTELFDITDGDVLFAKPYILHTACRLDKGHYIRYYVNIVAGFLEQYARQFGIEDLLEDLNEHQFFKLSTKSNEALYRRMIEHFNSIRRQSEKQTRHWQEIIYAELLLLLSDLHEGISELKHREPSSPNWNNSGMRKILDYIDLHLLENITLSSLSADFYLSRYYICRMFKRHTGLTVTLYINRKKIMIAQQMLSNPDTTITEACYASGFNHMQYFCKVFKEITGFTPSQYIRSVRNPVPGQIRLNDRHDSI